MPRIIVILLILLSLCVTVLIGLTVYARQVAQHQPPSQQPADVHDPSAPDPIVYFDVPPFSLTERSGSTVTRDDLRGKVWIADFIFTRCSGTCPLLSLQMAKVQGELAKRPTSEWDQIRLVSFSVDPDYDTPAVLRDYAARPSYNADPTHWLFLTGPRPAMWSLLNDGFKLPVWANGKDASMPIAHSSSMVLVDKLGRVRGTYEGTDSEHPDQVKADHDKLMRDLERVLKE